MQLVCENLTIGYEDGAVASGISFNVDAGDYLCILGENGSGKTTLMKTLLQLIEPLDGNIELKVGNDGCIGYMPQATRVQKDFPASVEEIVLSGCLKKTGKNPFFKKSHKVQAHVNMKKMNICDLAKQSYRNLSGGQQQRVLLARALCAAEDMLLLDEPTAGLDVASTAEMYEYINKLNKEGMTIIMISHDLEAVKYATHILEFDETIDFMTREEYKARKAVR